MKSRYSNEDRGTDRQTDWRTFQMIFGMTRLSKLKISWRRGKQYSTPVTLGEGIII